MNTRTTFSPPADPVRSPSFRRVFRRGFRRCRAAVAVMTVVVLVASACTFGGTTPSTRDGSATLTIGLAFAPTSTDPGNAGGGNVMFLQLAYDSLIHMASDGSLKPGLATSWNFVGVGNTTFELHLRSGVQFSDGTALTADVVKANLDRYRSDAGLATASQLALVTEVSAVDPLTVRLTLSGPDPALPTKLSEFYGAGDMISQAAVTDPKKMADTTYGAGPYTLDSSATVAGDHYTFTPNPNYWNKSAVNYDKVVLKVLPNPNTAVAALQSGQVDFVSGTHASAASAKAAGLQVIEVPHTWVGLALADRAGTLVPALADVRVRQAINYSIDRETIASGLVDTYGGPTPTEQIVLPDQDGYNNTTRYSYDIAKAKQLLAQAGYANGFTLPVVSWAQTTPVLQAVANNLAQVGIKLEITDAANNTDKYLQDVPSGKFAAYGITFGQLPVSMMGPLLFLPSASFFNPFKTSDPQIESLYRQAAEADPITRAKLDQEIVGRIVDLGWFAPVLFQPVSYFARSTVTGIQATPANPIPNPVEWRPAQ